LVLLFIVIVTMTLSFYTKLLIFLWKINTKIKPLFYNTSIRILNSFG
jgi:hypothetical protein